MRILFPLLLMLTISNFLFSQDMVIYKVGGTSETIAIANIDSIIFPFQCGVSVVTYAGKIYHSVLIGAQCWLKENLDVGTRINVSSDQTNNSTIEKYCYNNDPDNCTTYGGLYQWAETVQYLNGATNSTFPDPPLSGNVRGICPSGWHIPSIDELSTLETSVSAHGFDLIAVGQCAGATNASGFSALLAGRSYGYNDSFADLNIEAIFWATTAYSVAGNGQMMHLNYGTNYLWNENAQKWDGLSVRCIKD